MSSELSREAIAALRREAISASDHWDGKHPEETALRCSTDSFVALCDMAEAWRASREAGDVDGTPRTDEQERSAASMATYPGKVVKSGFARLLEIELKAERQTTKQLADRLSAPAGDTVQVPREPTQVMCQAGQEKAREWPKFPLRISAIYRAMLAAAPSAQKGEEAQGGSGDASGTRK